MKGCVFFFLEFILGDSFHLLADLNAFPGKKPQEKITCLCHLTTKIHLLGLAFSIFSPNTAKYSRYEKREENNNNPDFRL